MTFQKVLRRDQMVGSENPFITIRPSRIFSFNSEFTKRAELGTKFNWVVIRTDPENWKIAFEFHNNKSDINSFKLYKDGGAKSPAKSMNTTAHTIFKHNKWIEKVANTDDPLLRRFEPEKDPSKNKWWIIRLRPSFEKEVKNITDIPPHTAGIYRYIKGKDVVYIGKGNIRKRANAPEREDWEFDKIEYSIIEDKNIMNRWESYWINQFREREGRLPLYNKLAGQKNK